MYSPIGQNYFTHPAYAQPLYTQVAWAGQPLLPKPFFPGFVFPQEFYAAPPPLTTQAPSTDLVPFPVEEKKPKKAALLKKERIPKATKVIKKKDPSGRIGDTSQIAGPHTIGTGLKTRRCGGKLLLWSYILDILMDPADGCRDIVHFTGSCKKNREFEFQITDRAGFTQLWLQYMESKTSWASIQRNLRGYTNESSNRTREHNKLIAVSQKEAVYAFKPEIFVAGVTFSIEEVRRRVQQHSGVSVDDSPPPSIPPIHQLLDRSRSETRLVRNADNAWPSIEAVELESEASHEDLFTASVFFNDDVDDALKEETPEVDTQSTILNPTVTPFSFGSNYASVLDVLN